ncbi:MAG: hypothetical protein H7175_16525 [Burkholderiales bacterium]|nr:hypothetical protein [Anaerolineae bacterium]
MGRIINTDGAGKRRSQNMRSAAEILRRLSQKTEIDDEVKDMVSMLVFCFRDIDESIQESAVAWEKRDYWVKAEEFRQRWSWAGDMADSLQVIVYQEDWSRMPIMMAKLLPRVADIKITKLTRKESLWQGSYTRLLREKPPR